MKGYLIPLFAVATLFPRLLDLPHPFQQVQLTELLFLPILWLFRNELVAQVRKFPAFTAIAASFVLVNLLSGIAAGSAGAVLESGARGYLAVVALLTAAHLDRYGAETLIRWWRQATLVLSVLALLYYLMIVGGVLPDLVRWVARFPDYPYLGAVYRMRASANTYGMWVMLVLPGLLLAFDAWRRGRAPAWPVLVILLAIVPTLSKEILLAAAGLLGLSGLSSISRRAGMALLSMLLLLGTHFLVVAPDGEQQPISYMGRSTGLSIAGYDLVESVYVPIKRAALRVGVEHPWLGVGPGQFVYYSEAASQPGELPPGFGPFDPHSTWTGAFAESGVLGVLLLLGLVVLLISYGPGWRSVAGVLLFLFVVSSLFKDVLNFRGLWVIVGWYLAVGRVADTTTGQKSVPSQQLGNGSGD